MMEAQSIVENNNLIADFMGGKYRTDLPFTYEKTGWINTPANDNNHIAQSHQFRYHTSWDWLMPVVEKIESIGSYYVKIQSTGCAISNDGRWFIMIGDLSMTKMQAVYKAVIEFIQWYNQHKDAN